MTDFVFGSIDDVGAALGRYAVLTQDVPWSLVKDRIEGRPVSVTMVTNLEHKYLDRVADALPAPIDTVVGIGGGVSIDAAKYCAWKRKCSAIFVPTILSVDAYVSLPVAVRENGVVNYFGNVVPDKIVIDYRAIQSAPKRLNRAGTGDVYSCRTALFDWKLSHEKTGESYDAEIAARAQRLVDRLIEKASDIRDVTVEGIRTLVDLHAEANHLIAIAGKARPEEGSEHVFFYALEELTKRYFLHGEVVGTGIYIVSYLQSKDEKEVARVMDGFSLMFRPLECGITKDEFVSAALHMKQYSRRERLPFTILDVAEITRGDAERSWDDLSAATSKEPSHSTEPAM